MGGVDVSDDPKWKRDYDHGRLVMPHEGAVSYADARAEERSLRPERDALKARVAELGARLRRVQEILDENMPASDRVTQIEEVFASDSVPKETP
jgi:hypothetical protein